MQSLLNKRRASYHFETEPAEWCDWSGDVVTELTIILDQTLTEDS